MRKYLLPQDAHYYKANMHSHTMVSDGNFEPDEMKEVYMAQGYSIVAYTDHDVIVDHSDLTDESFVAITSGEYAIADNEVSPVAIYPKSGADMEFSYKKVVHMNLYAKDPHNTFHVAYNPKYLSGRARNHAPDEAHRDGEDFERVLSTEGLNQIIKMAKDAGFLVTFNHPHWSMNRVEDMVGLEGLMSLEIYNGATDYMSGMDYCPEAYDWLIRSGMRLGVTAGDDNHNWRKDTTSCFSGYTMIAAPSLTYENVIKALENGDYYACAGKGAPEIRNLYVEDDVLHVECSPAAHIYLNCGGRQMLAAHAAPGETIEHGEFKLTEDLLFFRVTVQDEYRRRAHTSAYFLADIL